MASGTAIKLYHANATKKYITKKGQSTLINGVPYKPSIKSQQYKHIHLSTK